MNYTTEIHVLSLDLRPKNQFVTHERAKFSPGAHLLHQLVSIVTAAPMPDGETSNGSQRLRLLAPSEVVARAASIADMTIAEMEKRGWVAELPGIDMLYGDAPEKTGFITDLPPDRKISHDT